MTSYHDNNHGCQPGAWSFRARFAAKQPWSRACRSRGAVARRDHRNRAATAGRDDGQARPSAGGIADHSRAASQCRARWWSARGAPSPRAAADPWRASRSIPAAWWLRSARGTNTTGPALRQKSSVGSSEARVLAVAAHALVETYAVLTRLPAPHRLAPADAWTLIDTNFARASRVLSP